MNRYPKSAQKAIKKLIKCNLDFNKVSTKHALELISYNIFTKLPVKYYGYAISLDVTNILAFNKEVVLLNDLKDFLLTLPNKIPSRLKQMVQYYKQHLITDRNIVIKLAVSNMLNESEVYKIVNAGIVSHLEIAIYNPTILTHKYLFTLNDLKTILLNTSIKTIKTLYTRVSVSLTTVLAMEKEFSVPPLHASLRYLQDYKKAYCFIKKYPNENVINYIGESVKSNKKFIDKIIHLIKNLLPSINFPLNRYISKKVNERELQKIFGIYFYVMFDNLTTPFINTYRVSSLTEQELRFVCRYISLYNQKSKPFVASLRKYLYRQGLLYPQKVFTNKKNNTSGKRFSLNSRRSSVNEITDYVNNDTISGGEWLNYYKHNYVVTKFILECEACNSLKIKALQQLKKQVIRKTDTLGVLYLTIVKLSCKYVYRFSGGPPRYYDIESFDTQTDAGLLSLLSKLCFLASKSIINTQILGNYTLWSPVTCLLKNITLPDFTKLLNVAKYISPSVVNFGGNLLHVSDINIYELFDYSVILNYGARFVVKLLLISTMFEYIFTILVLRHKRSDYSLKSFLDCLLKQCLKAFNVSSKYAKKVYINEVSIYWELELLLYDNNVNNTPMKIYDLILKILSILFGNMRC